MPKLTIILMPCRGFIFSVQVWNMEYYKHKFIFQAFQVTHHAGH